MEERRLKTILSHLSACASSQMGKSCVLNATSKAEKHTVFLPGSMHLQHTKQIARTSLFRSKSSSDMLESRLVGIAEEFPARGDERYAASREELLSHVHSLVSPTEQSRDVTKTHTQGYCLEATKFKVMQHRSSDRFHLDCSSPGAAKFERSLQCKPSHLKDEHAVDFEGKQIDSSCSIPLDQRVSKYQSQAVDILPPSSLGDHHQEIAHEPHNISRTSDVLGNTEESSIQTFRDSHTLDPQPADVGNDGVGSISRNNVMTGQRRRIVEDCIFCLIIQGQSPAFKLYEDDMCVCILDVHPLSHGHSLLIPKTHFPSLELTPPEVAAAMCATVPFISMALMQATNCDSFNLLVNSGKAAGQVVFHTHFHIIPRRTGDNLWRSEDCNRRTLPVGHETALLVQQIRHNLSNKHL